MRSFSKPEARTLSGLIITFCSEDVVSPTKALKRADVALMPINTGIGERLCSWLPLIKRCMIVVAIPACFPCIPLCASSIMKYNLLFFAVFSIVSHMVYCLESECRLRFPAFPSFCVFKK